MKNILKSILFLSLILFIGCTDKTNQKRWYTKEQVSLGAKTFKNNCAICHKDDASGTKEWKQRLSDGSLSPPPLNGTAHTWHHSFKTLKTMINEGGAGFGGKMPSFEHKLLDEEIEAIIAFFQNKWDDRIYRAWFRISGLKDKS